MGNPLELTVNAFATACRRKAEALRGVSFEKPLKSVAVAANASTRENFAGAHAPDGTLWLALKRPRPLKGKWGKKVKARRAKTKEHDQPLRDKGILWAAASSPGAQYHRQDIGRDSLVIGTTNLSYAGIHQRGGTIHKHAKARQKPWVFGVQGGQTIFTRRIRAHTITIPARPFLGWSEPLLQTTESILGGHMAKVLGAL